MKNLPITHTKINKKLEKELQEIKNEVLQCKKCPLYKTRTYPVIGQGSHQAEILFCGEAPGSAEDKSGFPFCGASGKILDELLSSISLKRQEVYICNILKCRPPGNRNPQREEIEACIPYLERQIQAIKPKIICALGNYSASFILEKYGLKAQIQGISKIHGEIFETDKGVKIIPLYHPAVVVYNRNMKEVLKKDFKILNKNYKN